MSSVAAILFNRERTALYLMKRSDVPVWVFPGGGIELNESPEEAILREIKEEMGFTCKITRKIAFYEKSGPFTKPTHFFECQILFKGTRENSETQDVKLFSLSTLPPLVPNYTEWLQDALANHPETLHKKMKSITLWSILKAAITHPILFSRFLLARIGYPLNTRS